MALGNKSGEVVVGVVCIQHGAEGANAGAMRLRALAAASRRGLMRTALSLAGVICGVLIYLRRPAHLLQK